MNPDQVFPMSGTPKRVPSSGAPLHDDLTTTRSQQHLALAQPLMSFLVRRARLPPSILPPRTLLPSLTRSLSSTADTYKMPEPQILRTEECPSDAKWLKLEKIHWKDQGGKERIWEAANRKTRTEAGVDSECSLPSHLPNSSPSQASLLGMKLIRRLSHPRPCV